MIEFFNNLSVTIKLFIIIITQTVYLTWWVTNMENNLKNNTIHILENRDQIVTHTIRDREVLKDTIRLAENVSNISIDVEEHSQVLNEIVAQHAKCSVIMESLINRLESLEERL